MSGKINDSWLDFRKSQHTKALPHICTSIVFSQFWKTPFQKPDECGHIPFQQNQISHSAPHSELVETVEIVKLFEGTERFRFAHYC